jgi:hypothetical protein
MPVEYCEFDPSWEQVKPWCLKNHPDLFPHLVKPAAGDGGAAVEAPPAPAKGKKPKKKVCLAPCSLFMLFFVPCLCILSFW